MSRFFCALDTTDLASAVRLAGSLAGVAGGIKLGLEFFCAHGPQGVRQVQEAGLPIFLDLKFHDIPNTVAGAIASIVPLQPIFTTLHACGGGEMIKAAVQSAADSAARLGVARPRILAVTVLTSMDEDGLQQTGVSSVLGDQVKRLASLAQKAGADGVVCSAHEVAMLRRECGPDFTLMVPGIRPLWATSDDQKRITTPRQAIEQGADWLVIGRPITAAADPLQAALRILDDLA